MRVGSRWWVVAFLTFIGVPVASAVAAPVTYEFEGFLTSRERCDIQFDFGCIDDGSSFYPASFVPGMKFTGTMTLDTTLTGTHPLEGGTVTAPVLDFELHNAAGVSLHRALPAGQESYLTTTQRDVSLGYFVWPDSVTDEVALKYQAVVDGKIPANAANVDPAALQPSHWLLFLSRATCVICRPADTVEHFLGHITAIRRQGSGSENSYVEPFTTTPAAWLSQGGSWSAVNGQYKNAANVSFTSSVHTAHLLQNTFEVSARLFSGFSASGNTLGLIFNYVNASNFYEVRFNPLGTVTLNAVVNGTRTMLQSGRYTTSGAGTFFNASVRRAGNRVTVFAGGMQIFDVEEARLSGGFAGVFASWNLARFDDFRIDQGGPVTAWNLTRSTFDTAAPGWTPLRGSWSVQNGRYGNSTNAQFVVSLADQPFRNGYSIDADILPSWIKSGNQSGFVYDYENFSNYREVRFVPSPGGSILARFVEVRNLVPTVVAELPNLIVDLREISLVRRGDSTILRWNSTQTFGLRQTAPPGFLRVGLLASWNLVTFDNVVIGAPPQ